MSSITPLMGLWCLIPSITCPTCFSAPAMPEPEQKGVFESKELDASPNRLLAAALFFLTVISHSLEGLRTTGAWQETGLWTRSCRDEPNGPSSLSQRSAARRPFPWTISDERTKTSYWSVKQEEGRINWAGKRLKEKKNGTSKLPQRHGPVCQNL